MNNGLLIYRVVSPTYPYMSKTLIIPDSPLNPNFKIHLHNVMHIYKYIFIYKVEMFGPSPILMVTCGSPSPCSAKLRKTTWLCA